MQLSLGFSELGRVNWWAGPVQHKKKKQKLSLVRPYWSLYSSAQGHKDQCPT
jgi:hypothetical protein